MEQKNGAIVRRLVGYRRLECMAAAEALARLYAASRLFVNFFQRSFKLAEKTLVGARVSKRYHALETPCARLLASEAVPDMMKARLRKIAENLDPLRLLVEIRAVQNHLAALASGETRHTPPQRHGASALPGAWAAPRHLARPLRGSSGTYRDLSPCSRQEPRMKTISIRHHNATAEGFALGLLGLFVLLAVVLVVPGAVLVFVIDRLAGLALDRAQLWTFAVLGSVAMTGGLAVGARSFSAGARRFTVVAFAIAAGVMIARFGFHARWPEQLWNAFAGQGGA